MWPMVGQVAYRVVLAHSRHQQYFDSGNYGHCGYPSIPVPFCICLCPFDLTIAPVLMVGYTYSKDSLNILNIPAINNLNILSRRILTLS